MISAPLAHIGGIPIEETLASFGPALLVAFGVAWAQLRARLRPVHSRAGASGKKRGARRAAPPRLSARAAQPGSVSGRQSENRQPAASSSTSAKVAATPAGSTPMRGRRRPGVAAGAGRACR
jgi:hypothetical protein